MKNNKNIITPRVSKAIDIFLDALNEGTLKAGRCSTCAVGNLVRAGMLLEGKDIAGGYCKDTVAVTVDGRNVSNRDWRWLFLTSYFSIGTRILTEPVQSNGQNSTDEEIRRGRIAISFTDFTEEELSKIENVFEVSISRDNKTEVQALAAVVDLMLTFDDITSTSSEACFVNRVKKNVFPIQ